MKYWLRIFTALLLSITLLVAERPAAAQTPGPQARIGTWTLATVADWQAGVASGTLVTNNSGGELRLADDQRTGSFITTPFQAAFAANAAGLLWEAELPPGTQVRFALRSRLDAPSDPSDAGWSAWYELEAGNTRAATGAWASPTVVALPRGSQYLQLRINLSSELPRASASLRQVTVSYLDTAAPTPLFATGLPRQPILFGPATLTQRPAAIMRRDWSGRIAAAQPQRSDPLGVIIHQIDATLTADSGLDFMRALLAYQTLVLGWDDLSYHYLIDPEGNLYEGRLGGPTSRVPQVVGGDRAVHIALIVPREAAATPTVQGTLVSLLAWLGQAYDFAPTGQHSIGSAGGRTTRPNIAAHAEVVPTAPDPFPPVRNAIAQWRTLADQSTVRARWYFAEGNVNDYSQRLSFFNPSGTPADARVTLVRPGAAPVTRIVDVPSGARSDLIINDLVQDASALPAIVESSAPLLAERSMGLTTDIGGGPGISRLSRVWYFAEGSTVGTSRTYLVLFNPNAAVAQATITYMRRDGTNLSQAVEVAGQGRLVITVGDITQPDGSLPMQGTDFGVQIIANQPIAAERTMRFGEQLTGMHTGRGIDTLAREWHFAEGTTEGDFRMRLLVLNPNRQATNVEASFMGPDGQHETRRYAVPPRTQLMIDANAVVPDLGVSSFVRADRPVAVERALGFNNGAAGSVGAGATAPGLRWAFVDGRTTDATYYLCVSNPGRLPAAVNVAFRFSDGAVGNQSFSVPPGARYTMAVHEFYPDEPALTAVVRATQPIIAERSLYPGGGVRGGFTVLGLPLP
ncbi:MAG: N-acetylmuramoyl-L-alanine amidase [Candidatus Viridilinea halotolerans]|uniref:N-acetylmuramoyl-L-alanine amidase n=1 Tax=Candidatus Viridilinea halotolerans TaxID=2491704 RepID=A0A426U7I9_9CHLR|nr:MAG: N-acetylmuramoyl-L-alanine amidase [Candidatus Viridilinea halotolerans]